MSELRRTAFHAQHQQLGGRLVPFAGWELPVQYSSIAEEHRAVRERVGLFDVSHMGQIYLSGPGAIECAERLLTCRVANLGVDRARYGLMLNETGGCIDDIMLTRLAEDSVFLCVNASNVEKCATWIRAQAGPRVAVEDRSDETALLALQGPKAKEVLARWTGPDTPLPKRFRVTHFEIAGVSALVSATGYTGSPGFELYLAAQEAPRVFEALLEAGAAHGLLPAGLGARDTLRLEAALPLYGHELDEKTSPLEAGLERFVKLDVGGFLGAEALARRGAGDRRLVGFEMEGRGIARADYDIVHDGEVVGRVTSGAPSPTLGKSIGLGYVPPALSAVGQSLGVRVRKRDIDARVVETPFFRA